MTTPPKSAEGGPGDSRAAAAASAPLYTDVERTAARALQEDLNSTTLTSDADLTTASTVAAGVKARARIIAREGGVIAGLAVARAVFHQLDSNIRFDPETSDGCEVTDGEVVVRLEGAARALLTAERTALNFLQRLSGTASLTRRFATAIAGTGVHVTDTRKTTPGMRHLEKYAVRCGGGISHRAGLYDAVLIKENHAAAAGGVAVALLQARERSGKGVRLMVEARNLDEVTELVELAAVRPDRILLDNMPPELLREAVALIRRVDPPIEIEATGRVGLENARELALTGIDVISVGALTHSAPALDLSLLFDNLTAAH